MNTDVWQKLVDTPYQSYVDLEDPENSNFQIKRFYQHNSDWTNYVECDSRYAAQFSPLSQDPHIVERISHYNHDQLKTMKYYMRSFAWCENHDIMKFEVYLNGIKLDQREQRYIDEGKEYSWEWAEIKVGPRVTTFYNEDWQDRVTQGEGQNHYTKSRFTSQITPEFIEQVSYGSNGSKK